MIQEKKTNSSAFWQAGFRPFFFGAGVFSMLATLVWLWVYQNQLNVYHPEIPPSVWHAHEMLYGYAMAIITGFLFTSVKVWTGLRTPIGKKLAVLFFIWMGARICNTFDFAPLYIGASLDILFDGLFILAVTIPLVQAKQWKQMSIIGKLALLFVFNIFFYLNAFGLSDNGSYWAIYGGFYTTIGLVLMMARRLIPFFIERGVGYPVTIDNSRIIDLTSMILFFEILIGEVFSVWHQVTAWCALILFVIHMVRLWFWFTPGILRKALLWSLYVAYAFIVFGFLMLFLSKQFGMPLVFAIHTFAVGGFGLMSLGIMARVSLAHTGRNIHEPSKVLAWLFILLVTSAIIRIIFPIFDMRNYIDWIVLSGWLWCVVFFGFILIYSKILLTPDFTKKSS